MSRSFKKPYVTEKNKRQAKRAANKRVRQAQYTAKLRKNKDKQYKKLYCSWNITDWRIYFNEPKYRRK